MYFCYICNKVYVGGGGGGVFMEIVEWFESNCNYLDIFVIVNFFLLVMNGLRDI